MKRRNLLINFLAAIGAAVAAPFGFSKTKTVKDTGDQAFVRPERHVYRNYLIRFTGWKGCQTDDSLVGQWVADAVGAGSAHEYLRDGKHPRLIASVPGEAAAHAKWDSFWIAPIGEQKAITHRTPESIKEAEKTTAYKRLLRMINCVRDSGKEGLSISEWNEYLDQNGLLFVDPVARYTWGKPSNANL